MIAETSGSASIFCRTSMAMTLALLSSGALASDGFAQVSQQGDWQRTLEAARKEGKVVAGIPTSPELRTGMEKAFGEKFKGIQLELVAGPATALASRQAAVARSGRRAGAKASQVIIWRQSEVTVHERR